MKGLAVWLLVLTLLTGCAQGAADDKAAGSGSQGAVSQGERTEAEDQANSSEADRSAADGSGADDAEADRSAADDQAETSQGDSSTGDSSAQERALSKNEELKKRKKELAKNLPDFDKSPQGIKDYIAAKSSELEDCTPLSAWETSPSLDDSSTYTYGPGLILRIGANSKGKLDSVFLHYFEQQGERDEDKFRNYCYFGEIIAKYFELDPEEAIAQLDLEHVFEKETRVFEGRASYTVLVEDGSVMLMVLPQRQEKK